MLTPPKRRIGVVDQLNAEWKATGKAGPAVRSLHAVARRDDGLGRLVFGGPSPGPSGPGSPGSPGSPGGRRGDRAVPACPTPYDLVAHLHRASGRIQREEAARLVSVLLRESAGDPFLARMLVQALLPGLLTVARKLRWGHGGEWRDSDEFFGELLETTWVVLQEWAGQARPYAVLDLLSAIRCRMRRQLFRGKDRGVRLEPLDPEIEDTKSGRIESDLEELTRVLIERRRDGMCAEEAQVVYANSVLGYSISELATVSGRDRRALYAYRRRGRDNLCA